MSDHTEILDLLSSLDINNPATYDQYARMEWLWLQDSNNQNYNSGNLVSPGTASSANVNFPQYNQIIRIDTKDLLDKWIGYKQAFWLVPISYSIGGSVAGLTFSAPSSSNGITPLAVVGIKNGLYQLIDGLKISINGVDLNKLNSKYLNFVNQFHAMIDNSVDYIVSIGQWTGQAKDTLKQMVNVPAQSSNISPNGFAGNAFPYQQSYYPRGSNVYGTMSGNNTITSYNPSTGNDATEFITVGITGITGGTGITFPQLGLTGIAPNTVVDLQSAQTGTAVMQLLSQVNMNFNKGFLDRINFTNVAYTVNSGIGFGQFNAAIPLCIINDFFRQLPFPLLGTQFYFQINLANPQLSTTQPFMIDVSALTPQVTNSVMHTIAETLSVIIGNSNLTNTRLYYPKITFNAQTLARVNAMLSSPQGITHEIVWYDNYVTAGPTNVTNSGPNSTLSYQITPGISRPVRVVMFSPLTGSVSASSTVPINSQGINSCFDAAPAFSVGQWTNINLLVDTNPLFPNNLIYDIESYNLLKEEFIGHGRDPQDGSQISFQDFCTKYRYYTFNCSRMINSLPDPAKSVSLQIVGNRMNNDSVPVDLYFMIEVEQRSILSFGQGKVTVV